MTNDGGDFLSLIESVNLLKAAKRVAVIGNTCSGKTTLSRQLALVLGLPLIHIDSIQYLENLELRDPNQTREILINKAGEDEWILDGVGPLKVLEDRLKRADVIIMLRPSLAVNLFYLFKRQLILIFIKRQELPRHEISESGFKRTFLLFKHMLNVHKGLWKQLDRILRTETYRNRVLSLNSASEVKILIDNLH